MFRGEVVLQRLLRWVICLGLLLLPAAGLAVTGEITKDPSGVVSKYAGLDYKGARLEAASQETLHPYIAWTQEPLWGKIVVVDGYDLRTHTKDWQIISMLEVVIPVDYRVLGSMYWKSATFLPETRVEQVRFHVKAIQQRWRVIAPQFPPHVGLTRVINFVRHAILQEQDTTRRDKLTALRESLERVRP